MLSKEKTKEKRWILKSSGVEIRENEVKNNAQKLGISPVVSKLLFLRGYRTAEEMRSFLRMESEMLLDPFLMKDCDRAVERILDAVKKHEKITVWGDYDVDGVTAVCTLYLYLESIGATVDYYIPNRATDGYGVTKGAIDVRSENGTQLIITVDTGITANDECDYAKTLGIDFVITDHHECRSDLPKAVAVVNPHRPDCPYPFKDLAGVGVVFKLICACEEKRTGKGRFKSTLAMFDAFSDLVAIGTIADVMPIREENRIIVSRGLSMMEKHPRMGLAALIEASQTKADGTKPDKKKKTPKITSSYIGYILAPRINAAGRILSASIAVELFLQKEYGRALNIAEELCQANRDRQNEENKIIKEASKKLEPYLDAQENPVIVLDSDHWHHGVIGIVASRITEKYSRPAILVSFEGSVSDTPTEDDIGKGSGRSVKGMNLVDALFHCQDYLVKFGGHELAAGLSVTRKNLPALREGLNRFAKENLTDEDMIPTLEADMEISFNDLTLSLAESLGILEPYGVGNPVPTLIVRNVHVDEIVGISEGKHTRLSVSSGTNAVTAMYFGNSPASLGISVGDEVDILFNLDINEFLGRRSVQLIVKDIRFSQNTKNREEAERAEFDRIWSGAAFDENEDVLPTRENFAAVYRYLYSAIRLGINEFSYKTILLKTADQKIGYVKMRIILKVMSELNILRIEEDIDVCRVFLSQQNKKTDLDKSTLLRKLRLQMRKY